MPNFCIKLCEEGIELNNIVAHYKYALLLILDKTKNSKQSKIEARKHLEISIDIGLYHLKVTKNYKESFKWFERSLNMNKTKATIKKYGLCFLKGVGVAINIQKAKEIFSIGIQKNDPNLK